MYAFLLVLFFFAIIIEKVKNNDFFSPVKIYYAFLFVNVADILLNPDNYLPSTFYCVLVYIVGGMIVGFYQNHRLPKLSDKSSKPTEKYEISSSVLFFAIWGLTLIPFTCQVLLIADYGSLDNYISAFGLNQEGNGILRMLLRSADYICLAYVLILSIVEMHPNQKKFHKISFCLHLLLCLFFALLTGSRGRIILGLLNLLFVFHYFYCRFHFAKAVLFGAVIVPLAIFWGSMRSNARYGVSGLIQMISEANLVEIVQENSARSLFDYGLKSLEIIYDGEFDDLQYGKTYGAGITMFIPRSVWPDKWEPGGVILTAYFQGNDYTRAYGISTGAIVEGIINFGYTTGFIVGILVLLFQGFFVVLLYRKFRFYLAKNADSRIIISSFFVWQIGSVFFQNPSKTEFAQLATGFIAMMLFYFFAIKKWLFHFIREKAKTTNEEEVALYELSNIEKRYIE